MQRVDESSYEEMISALQDFLSKAEEDCNAMESAAKDCTDNTDGDEVATKASAKVTKCVADIRSNFEAIQNIISALEEELEQARIAAAKADELDD